MYTVYMHCPASDNLDSIFLPIPNPWDANNGSGISSMLPLSSSLFFKEFHLWLEKMLERHTDNFYECMPMQLDLHLFFLLFFFNVDFFAFVCFLMGRKLFGDDNLYLSDFYVEG